MRCAKTSVSPVSARSPRVEAACRRSVHAIWCSLLAFLLLSVPARADVVADWTKVALHAVISSEQRSVRAAREMEMVHVAMFETMNFIEGIYVPRFVVKPLQPLRISSDVAAVAAAHYVLVRLYPEQEPALDSALRRSMEAMPDAREKSSALIAGKALGAIVYASWASDPSLADTSNSGITSKKSRVRASTRGTGANAVAWYWIVAQFAEAQGLRPIERARLYALVSMALSDLYGPNGDVEHFYDSRHSCAPCAVGAAVQVVLESELGPAGVSGRTAAGARATGAVHVSSRMREYGRGLSSELQGQTLIEIGEKLGRTVGLRALANYKRSRHP